MAPNPASVLALLLAASFLQLGGAVSIQYFDFHVKYSYYTRLCRTKPIATVNDQFPGPAITVHEGDRVLVNVINDMPDRNITIHWHGVRQLRMGWFDGPAYVTQCPIMPGSSFLYNFTVTGQRGTLFWHAHISWMRSTVHGAFIIKPPPQQSYPFPPPFQETPLVLGEWWNEDTEQVIAQALQSGGGPAVSDAYTINGQPGALYTCSQEDMFKLNVVPNQMYLLRIINAGLNGELFFSVAKHMLTVVEIDAAYTKPFQTDTIVIAPGQTTSVLLTTDQAAGKYYMAVRTYDSASSVVPTDRTTGTALIEYNGALSSSLPIMPTLPPYDDVTLATNFAASLRSLNSEEFPAHVPMQVDRNLFFTVGMGMTPCPHGQVCLGPSGGKWAAAVNNISLVLPTTTSLLQSFFLPNDGGETFPTDFPDEPPRPYDYIATLPPGVSFVPELGTRLSMIPYNSNVQLVLQDTNILGTGQGHPFHLHGYDFFVVGQGNGDYDSTFDPQTFNLEDPPQRNTVDVPRNGWVAVRFLADNPGVWFLHCHFEIHMSWGMAMVFLVTNGETEEESLQPPPLDLPTC